MLASLDLHNLVRRPSGAILPRGMNMAKSRKKSTTKGPHCKRVSNGKGGKRTMCFDAKGKITSKKKVEAYNKRKRGGRRKAA